MHFDMFYNLTFFTYQVDDQFNVGFVVCLTVYSSLPTPFDFMDRCLHQEFVSFLHLPTIDYSQMAYW